ncbi:hypothetical protein M422DRAFT_46958 [Sphaerobolus stellatus SS14]|uniref:Unplaced genomic scaffold SPHSTscaffold_38, whole genome shotgun sequence n=1 Tax=Sphaerobolus stellatus (strain SS14) TaxID=990650 RepID=A0A0C9UQD4_SPHS4|nr:hypothetical protein M422DRAFT_46958 [Sphaerobolus stellatus SS14]
MSNETAIHGFPTEQAFLSAVPYHYIPTEWICALFVGLFSATALIHLAQGMWYHLGWLLPTAVLAGTGEVIGWVARLWSSQNPLNMTPFLMQISATIIAPTPFIGYSGLATNFIILGRVIDRLGPQYSRLTPKLYSIIFLCADIVALIIQAVGGAQASDAASNGQDPNPGGHIMLGGIFFQMAALVFYMILAAEFLTRYNLDKPIRSNTKERGVLTKRLKLQLIGLSLMTFFIFVRTVYRSIELIDGWDGVIISTQWCFNAFDGAMIVLAMYTLNIFHPGRLLQVTQVNEPDIEKAANFTTKETTVERNIDPGKIHYELIQGQRRSEEVSLQPALVV